MPLCMTAMMALRMILAIFAAATIIGVQIHFRMVLPAHGFCVYIRSHDNIAQDEQQRKARGGKPVHSQAIVLKNGCRAKPELLDAPCMKCYLHLNEPKPAGTGNHRP